MTLEIDAETGAAYFAISNVPIVGTREIDAGVMGDYDAEEHLVGIEVLSVSKVAK